jgi:hypothetical protein
MAYPGIPVQRDAAELAAYLLVYLLAPLVGPNLSLTADIFDNVPVVRHVVIAELDEEAAGKIGAIGTARDAVCGHGASSYLALGAERATRALTETAFAIDSFDRKVKALGKFLEYAVGVLTVRVMPYAVYSAGSAIYSTNTGQVFAFHSSFTFLSTSAGTQVNGIVFEVGMSRQAGEVKASVITPCSRYRSGGCS